MKLQSVRIKTNDFPKDQREFVNALGGILNPFIDKLVIGFNKNFTVDDNLPFEFKTIDVVVDGTGRPSVFLTPTTLAAQTLTVQTNLKNFKGFICINATDLSGATTPSHTPFVSFTISGNTITISKITGLTTLRTYRLVLLGIS